MPDRLAVQRDDLARVVRLVDADGLVAELSPASAVSLGEEAIRAGRDLQTTQATLDAPEGPQTALTEAEVDRRPLAAVLDDDRPDADIGDVLNPDNPLEW